MAASLLPHLSKIRSPLGGEKVYKDECAFCFDTPEHETGLYVCMNTFLGLGKKYVQPYSQRTGNVVFLHMRRIKKQLPKKEDDPNKPAPKPTKMAIGVEGGFDVGGTRFEFEEINTIVVLPEWTEIPLTTPDLPDQVQISAASILAADSAAKAAELAAMSGTWEGDVRKTSEYASNLVQLDNGKKIPPTGWKCEKCEKTENLWLNLSDGSILCGRKFWDGSGGNNHAVEHYEACKYPLAVKLGTITPDGADVFCYAEDDMVNDPNLKEHLAHWGINIAAMEKTEKTMVELEIDLNQKIGEWDVITEAGSKLKPVYGPGYTGMINLGNSCYMNSVMQVLFTLPEFKRVYADAAERIFEQHGNNNPTEDFSLQMAKLGKGLLSGDYSIEPPEIPDDIKEPVIRYPEGIRPQMFKTLVGKGHPEFSTKKQQDAQEFLLHIIDMIEKNSRGKDNPVDCFRFEVEDRIMCTASNKVKYATRNEFILALPIPMEAATNKEAVRAYDLKKASAEAQKQILTPADIVRPRITLAACLEAFADTEIIPDFYSTAVQRNSVVHKTTRIKTFPDNLFIQLRKFTIGDDWVPKKLDVSIEIPDEINLEFLRGKGIQPGEEELPEAPVVEEPEFQIDDGIVMQLVSMGFSLEGCKKAVFHTKNAGVEYAMNWVMEHMEDPDFNDPFVQPSAAKKAKTEFVPDEEALMVISGMGFTKAQATKALKATNNNVERAADWIFSHADELDTPMETDAPSGSEQSSQERQYKDGSGRYKLVGFISHMGTSSMVGHYVCHILKDGRWTIFNDEKVALSANPPKDLAYLYHYRRV